LMLLQCASSLECVVYAVCMAIGMLSVGQCSRSCFKVASCACLFAARCCQHAGCGIQPVLEPAPAHTLTMRSYPMCTFSLRRARATMARQQTSGAAALCCTPCWSASTLSR
jgi:hypothetical protein